MKESIIVDGKEYVSIKSVKEKLATLFDSGMRKKKSKEVEPALAAEAVAVVPKKRGRPVRVKPYEAGTVVAPSL